ncbi:MAG: ATP-binding cassette domain-containing protein [Spirochaetales bacterium]|nr:ATP-binding cassette domain-containing protein [Spirochaetales bacterium]
MVRIKDLKFSYPDSTVIFNGFNWNIESGESWAVLGLSGAGKTTLLYLLGGLLSPSMGKVLINGKASGGIRPETGFIMQGNSLLPWATLEENIRLGFKIRKFYGADGKHSPTDYKYNRNSDDKLIEYWLDRLSIMDIREKFPSEISGGQAQRGTIARTMILKPDLLLMDEPFSSLDIRIKESLQNLILDLDQNSGRTRIIVTHNLEEAVFLGKRILVIREAGMEPLIYDNPESGSGHFRGTADFRKVCRDLQNIMGGLCDVY